VLATDWAPDAIAMMLRNAERNALAVEALAVSWTEPDALVARAPWDLVLASDVLYEPRNGVALLPLLPRLVDVRGEIWLADPGRPAATPFLEAAAETFTIDSRPAPEIPQGAVHHLRLRGLTA
jgi:predicted nicotinamide N-methyase